MLETRSYKIAEAALVDANDGRCEGSQRSVHGSTVFFNHTNQFKDINKSLIKATLKRKREDKNLVIP